MSVIKLTLPRGELPVNGKRVTFTAPCSCMETEALQIDGEQYTVVDTLCQCVTGIGGRWIQGAVVTVVLDVDNKRAYLQNSAGHGWQLAVSTDIDLQPNALGNAVGATVIPISAINIFDTDEIMVEFSGELTVDATELEGYADVRASLVSVNSELRVIAYEGEKKVLSIPRHRVVYKKHSLVNTNRESCVYVYFASPDRDGADWPLQCDSSTGRNNGTVNTQMSGDTQVSSLVGTVKIYTKSLF